MNFEKAYEALQAGKKIRRKEWQPLMHMRMADDNFIRTYKGETTPFYEDAHNLFSYRWNVVEDEVKDIKFIEAIEYLKMKKSIIRLDWSDSGINKFIFIDDGQFAMCKEVEFDFMPTWKCLTSTDWEIMK